MDFEASAGDGDSAAPAPANTDSGLRPAADRLASPHTQATTATALLAERRFPEALTALRRAVALGDQSPATALNLAIAEDRVGNRDKARALMRSIAVRLPDWDEPILRIAESLRAGNDLAGAEDAYRRVLEISPNRPAALIALGGLLLARNAADEARVLLLRGCGVAPANADAWYVLGLTLVAGGVPDRALSAFIKAQVLKPDDLSYALRGVDAAVEAGEAEAELVRLELLCARDPLNHVPLAGRAMLLDRMGHRDEAIDAMEASSVLAPKAAEPLSMLGGLLARTTQLARAEVVLRRACVRAPNDPQAHNDHAAVLMKMHQHAEARAILLAQEERHGAHPASLCNLANSTVYLGMQDEAVAIARRAIALAPQASLPRRTLANVLPYRQGTTAADLLAALADCAATLARPPQPAFPNSHDPDRKLTVGLLSGSLRSHPVGWLTIAGIETLDPDRFAVICLTRPMPSSDPITERFRAVAAAWLEVDRMSDAELAAAARERGVDILIDLGGYGEGGRMPACAGRLAPVQIKWVGMQNHSSGLPEMDWFLTDRWETPPGFEPLYTERLLRMPDGYVCYSPPPHAPDVVPPPALANGFMTFGCFNNLAKITPLVIETWCRILRRVPASRLVLKTHQFSDAATAQRVLAAFTGQGIEAERIEMRGSSGHRAFMREYGDIDIVLDPFPYSGGLTTCEALWMGVPTITLPGELFASRHSASHLSNAGLADWVTDSVDGYVDMAVARAGDPAALAVLRSGLRARVRASPLCDAPRFGRNLGDALRSVWRDWCARAS